MDSPPDVKTFLNLQRIKISQTTKSIDQCLQQIKPIQPDSTVIAHNHDIVEKGIHAGT